MKFYSLCSSSKGNCTYLGDGNHGILIDAGFGIRNYTNSMRLAGLNPDGIQAIFITHEHSDHISGLRKLTEKYQVPVYGSKGTLMELLKKEAVSPTTKLYEINHRAVQIGDWEIRAYHTSHDSAESLGYTVSNQQKKVALCTDLGYVSEEVQQQLQGSDFVLLESNYDVHMLFTGGYPPFLKERIFSKKGHLSNEDCAEQLKWLIQQGTSRFLLGHLSKENNLPQIALEHSVSYLQQNQMMIEQDYRLEVAPERNPGKVIEV